MTSRRCHLARSAAALALTLLTGGCGVRLVDEGLLDRCADLMRLAFPGGNIKVTKQETLAPPTASVASFAAAVAGERRNLPEGSPLLREVAVQCTFDDRILTGFRWTKGPLR